MRFRYRYDHLDCNLCADMRESGCPHSLCPHIMENLDDLRRDPAFIDAVENADILLTHHTPTLLHLNKIGFPDENAMRIAPEPEPRSQGMKPECDGCPYPRVGLFCRSADGSCVKTDYNNAMERGRTLCPA